MLVGSFMLVVHLFAGEPRARAEWVEISQSGYRRRGSDLAPSAATRPRPAQPERNVDHFRFDDHDDLKYLVNASAHSGRRKPFAQRINFASVERVDANRPDVAVKRKIPEPAKGSSDRRPVEVLVDKPPQSTERDGDYDQPSTPSGPGASLDGVVRIEKTDKIIDHLNNGTIDAVVAPLEGSTVPTDGADVEREKANPVNEKGNAPVETAKEDHSKHFAGIVKLIKIVQETITKGSHRTVTSKLKYLQELGDTIMSNVEERVEALWPAGGGGARRAGRSSRGDHVEFPSAESALMSISFLTFAVFLIKLVMQVIHTYKSKAMMVAPVFTTMGRAVLSRARN